ncbi:MAG: hypothetical protein ACTSX8_01570 [Alphaproteobacteria bacterium]
MTAPVQLAGNALTVRYTASAACTIGEAVILSADNECEDAAGATDLAVGIASATVLTDAEIDVYMFGYAVIPVTVGTGGATRGTQAVLIGDGFTDAAAHNSDAGAGNTAVYGIFLQSGAATTRVGLLLTGADSRGV